MPDPLDFLLDPWSPLSHKKTLRNDSEDWGRRPAYMSPEDYRRLSAYRLLKAYEYNIARYYIGAIAHDDPDERDNYREYGDAALLIDQTVAALLGDEQTIVVDGADADGETDPAAADRQEWLRAWADDEKAPIRLVENERHAVGLGDAVSVLSWSGSKQRVRWRTWDPGFYFPVLGDGADDDYPTRVHLLWEVEGIPTAPNLADRRDRVYRRTWTLGPILPAQDTQPNDDGLLRRVISRLTPDGPPVLMQGDTMTPDGTITRRYPWQDPGEPDSAVTCYYSDAFWFLDELKGPFAQWTVDTLPDGAAHFQVTEDGQVAHNIDLRIDFIPVVHEPNSPAGADHFGQSSIAKVAQILDDISGADTDLQASAATTGGPIFGLRGAQLPTSDGVEADVTIRPNVVLNLGPDGVLTAVDTSPQLAALQRYVESLQDRLNVNSRVPDVATGRAALSTQLSGIALAIKFAPLKSMIAEMRLTRADKYPLLFKFVQRIAQANGALPDGPSYRAEYVFGSFIPTDLPSIITAVSGAVTGKVLSVETGVRMLLEAGVPIDSVADEVDRIQKADFGAARDLFEATGDTDAARARLGLAPAPPPAPPSITIPTPTGGNGALPNVT